MQVYSFIDNGFGLDKVEVEVSLVSGLPDLKIMGLPDTVIKESAERIKSAIRCQGFQWPKAQKVLVQLKPSNVKKSSRGMDLAIAAGILGEMGQVEFPNTRNTFYGELSLKGEVSVPEDAMDINDEPFAVVTGESTSLPFFTEQVRTLAELPVPVEQEGSEAKDEYQRPKLMVDEVTSYQAFVLSVIGAGEHNTLFVGAPGTGKTTSAFLVAQSLALNNRDTLRDACSIWRRQGERLKWRPVVVPHHTSSHIAIVGGGQPPSPGEITRAHGGALILDELLEFRPSVQEALREPIERGVIRVSRSSGVREFPADFLMLATSNLCPCGHFVPEVGHKCRCRHKRLLSYLEKFSGPILDRFAITIFASAFQKKNEKLVPAKQVAQKIEAAQEFARGSRGQTQLNSQISAEDLSLQLKGEREKELVKTLTESLSIRRRQSLLKVARTIADLNSSESIHLSHLEKAKRLTLSPFKALQEDVFKYV